MPDSAKRFEALTIPYNGESLTFAVVRSARRKTSCVVMDAQGVHIAAPIGQPLLHLTQALEKQLQTILERDHRFRTGLRLARRDRQFVSGESLRFLGRPYLLIVVKDASVPVEIRGNRIRVCAGSRDAVQAILQAWYWEQASAVFPERVHLWARRLGVTPGRIMVRDQKTRWGSCDAVGNLRLNWKLVMAPVSLMDYVIAHELAHLRAPDHSPQFWAALRAVMPDYAARKAQLDLDGGQFEL